MVLSHFTGSLAVQLCRSGRQGWSRRPEQTLTYGQLTGSPIGFRCWGVS